MDGIKPVDPTFTPAGVVWANGVPALSSPVVPLWFQFGYQDPNVIRVGLMGVLGVAGGGATGGTYPGTPDWGPVPRPRRPDGKLVIPGMEDGDPVFEFGPEMGQPMRDAWNNFLAAYLELVRAYGEVAP